MTAYLKRSVDKEDKNEILELTRLAMKLNQYDVFEEHIQNVIRVLISFCFILICLFQVGFGYRCRSSVQTLAGIAHPQQA